MANVANAANLAPVVDGQRRVFCCHRATLSGSHVPNSLAAVDECLRAGVPRVEIDLRFLSDDGMLVLHDVELDRSTTGRGLVSETSTPAARQLRFRGDESVPVSFFEEVVDAVRGTDTLLQVDLKLAAPFTTAQLARLVPALEPIRNQVLVGSQAHWNVRQLAKAGIPVALDTTRHWHHFPGRSGAGLDPAREGLHGLWDDAPIAHMPGFAPTDYVQARLDDLCGLLPAVEWMVDFRTIRHLFSLGAPLGRLLGERGIELAAWTLEDRGRASTSALLHALFALGVTTIITDSPIELSSYVTVR